MASFKVQKKLAIQTGILDVILTAGHAKISIQFSIVNALTVEMDSFRAQNIVIQMAMLIANLDASLALIPIHLAMANAPIAEMGSSSKALNNAITH